MEETKAIGQKGKIAKEVAENEFNDWCEANMIDTDASDMNEDDEKAFYGLKKTIVNAVRDGRIVFDGRDIKYTISKCTPELAGQEVTIPPAKGAVYLALDGFKKGQDIKRLHAALSQMTGLADGVFRKMDAADFKVFQAVFSLFLAD